MQSGSLFRLLVVEYAGEAVSGSVARGASVDEYPYFHIGRKIFHPWIGRAELSRVTVRQRKMNKQMTPAEIELVQQSFARPAPISVGAALAAVESGPWPPPPNIPAAIAPAGMTMK